MDKWLEVAVVLATCLGPILVALMTPFVNESRWRRARQMVSKMMGPAAISLVFAIFILPGPAQAMVLPPVSEVQEQLKRQTAPAMQSALKEIFDEIDKKPEEQLYRLKAAIDPCSMPDLLNCRGLPGSTIRPAIDVALDHRRAIETRKDTDRSFYLSSAGLGMSILSFLLSIVVLMRKPKEIPELAT
jgi:hypothetical protein